MYAHEFCLLNPREKSPGRRIEVRFQLQTGKKKAIDFIWLPFFIGFILVLLPQEQLLYVPLVLTSLGVFYLGFEGYRLKEEKGQVYARARTIIRIGFAFLIAGSVPSFLVGLAESMSLTILLSGRQLILSIGGPLWLIGTFTAFGAVVYAKMKGTVGQK